MRSSPGSASWSVSREVPARIESTGVPAWTRSGATSSSTFGFTARTTRSEPSATTTLPSTASPPTCSASDLARSGSASENSIDSGAPLSPCAAAQPRASPPAMFPEPTKPTLMESTLFGARDRALRRYFFFFFLHFLTGVVGGASVDCTSALKRRNNLRIGLRGALALVEEAALEQAGLLLGGDLDVFGREQEDPL